MGYQKSLRHSSGAAGSSNKSGKGSSPSGTSSIHWTNVTLSPEQKKVLSETELDVEKWWDTVAILIERGHKFVINPKNDQGFVGISCIGVRDECPNKGCGLSGEGGTLDKAVRSLWFKMDLLDYQWFPSEAGADDDFR